MLKTVIIVSTLSGALAAESCADGITAGNKCTADYISKGTGDCAAAGTVIANTLSAYIPSKNIGNLTSLIVFTGIPQHEHTLNPYLARWSYLQQIN